MEALKNIVYLQTPSKFGDPYDSNICINFASFSEERIKYCAFLCGLEAKSEWGFEETFSILSKDIQMTPIKHDKIQRNQKSKYPPTHNLHEWVGRFTTDKRRSRKYSPIHAIWKNGRVDLWLIRRQNQEKSSPPHLPRRPPRYTLEHPVKICKISEPAAESDLGCGLFCAGELSADRSHPDLIEILYRADPGGFAEFLHKIALAQADRLRKLRNGYVFRIMQIHIVDSRSDHLACHPSFYGFCDVARLKHQPKQPRQLAFDQQIKTGTVAQCSGNYVFDRRAQLAVIRVKRYNMRIYAHFSADYRQQNFT